MSKKKTTQTRLGSVNYSILGVRHATMKAFFNDFDIDYLKYCTKQGVEFKELKVAPNFVYFLIEIKLFITLYHRDYYSDKSVEIISNMISRPKEEIENYFNSRNNKINLDYPYRYISSYALDYSLNKDSGRYNFLKYNEHHRYEGNFEYRRSDFND